MYCIPSAVFTFAGTTGKLGVLERGLDPPILPESGDPKVTPMAPSLASLLASGKEADQLTLTSAKSPSTAVIAEGLPPIASKLLERIRKWDYIDLADLLSDSAGKQPDIPSTSQGQVILVQSIDQVRKKKHISDIESWLQAFAIYAAALSADPSTMKEETTGLFSHMYLITQIAKDLGGLQWYKYDREFRERAAATNTRIWGTLNGRCLALPQSRPVSPNDRSAMKSRLTERKNRPGKQKNKACVKHNFETACGRSAEECYYDHVCWYCGAKEHVADACPVGPRHQKQRKGEKDSC